MARCATRACALLPTDPTSPSPRPLRATSRRRSLLICGARWSLGGPRQVGKTSLARALLPDPAAELSWDVPAQRRAILARELPPGDFWFFDEIHKYKGWRNYLEGLVDEVGPRQRILVTGSARLDLYRFGGDSLQGRYFYLRLHPFSVAELGGHADTVPALLALGGFPEPFLSGSERFARRWSLAYRERLVREEVTALESISDLGKLELLAQSLPERVGSPLSINALREDLQLSHATVARWVDVLERVYGIFRVAPFGAEVARSEEGAQALPRRLVGRRRPRRAVREHGREPSSRVGRASGRH
jgi:predicted AAA+ superfamily ATPase